jgi:hypothetical protein
MPEDKGLNRGGTGGQQGEISGDDPLAERDLQRGIQGEKLDKRNEQQRPDQKQQQDKQKIQPTHQVD